MRQEDKEIDGPDLERAEERKRETELVEIKEDELYDLDGLPEREVEAKRAEDMMAIMRTILAGEQIVINDLKLPKRQLTALEALKTAADGKDIQLSRFVYAEDRRALLEQALAVLQPELAAMQGAKLFEEMFEKVGELRGRLDTLEDSEETMEELGGRKREEDEGEDDAGDKDDKDDDDDATGDDTKKSAAKNKQSSNKAGDDDHSLTGPERPEKPKGPTTLGDVKEIEQAARASRGIAATRSTPEASTPTSPRWKRTEGGDGS